MPCEDGPTLSFLWSAGEGGNGNASAKLTFSILPKHRVPILAMATLVLGNISQHGNLIIYSTNYYHSIWNGFGSVPAALSQVTLVHGPGVSRDQGSLLISLHRAILFWRVTAIAWKQASPSQLASRLRTVSGTFHLLVWKQPFSRIYSAT